MSAIVNTGSDSGHINYSARLQVAQQMKISFVVPGTPVSKLRHRTFITKGGSQRQYTPPETILYENMVAICCREAMNGKGQERITGGIKFSARFYFPVPKTRAGRITEGQVHTQRPDFSNCWKAVEDGCNGVAWNDDCQIAVIGESGKFWTHGQARAEIEVEEL